MKTYKSYRYAQCEFQYNPVNKQWDIFYKGAFQHACKGIKACRNWIHEKRMKGFYPVELKKK